MCGPFEGWGKSVGGEEKQGEDEEHGGVGGDGGPERDDGDGGLESDDRAEKDSEKSALGSLIWQNSYRDLCSLRIYTVLSRFWSTWIEDPIIKALLH